MLIHSLAGLQDHVKKDQPGQAAPHITGQAIKSGIVRIWQSWRSADRSEGPSFTHKRGVTIQPIEVRGSNSGPYKESGAACRRNLFQRRRGGSSPLSPQQLEALAREDSMSPTSFRRSQCCVQRISLIGLLGQITSRKNNSEGRILHRL